jgi:hypothetical protein
MNRLAFTRLLGAFALDVPAAAVTQPQKNREFRIGYLGVAALPDGLWDAFRDALNQFGYVDGKNLSIERRHGRTGRTVCGSGHRDRESRSRGASLGAHACQFHPAQGDRRVFGGGTECG